MLSTTYLPSGGHRRRLTVRGALSLGAVAAAATGLAACGTPGASPSGSPSTPQSVSTGVGTARVTLTVTADAANTAMWHALAAAFKARYPNVALTFSGEQFTNLQQDGPRLVTGPGAPDLIQFPTLGNAVKDHLLTNLSPYAIAYGWTRFPQSQFAAWMISPGGTQRGTGSLYAVGVGYTVTGVYYNKAIAKKIGMSQPPSTLGQFTGLLARAKKADYLPLVTSGQDGDAVFPFQAIQMADAGPQQVTNWVYDKPGADINTPATVQAGETLQGWAADGYLPAGVNALNNTQAAALFSKGGAVFYYNGNWEAATMDHSLPGNVGFFLLPPAQAGGKYVSMSDPSAFVIPAAAKHPRVAAAFLNFIQTDATARQIIFDKTGEVPGGPSDAALPTAAAGSASADMLAAFRQINSDNGVAPYMANATASIFTETLIPQTQLLIGGKESPSAYARQLQSGYLTQLGS